MMKVVLRNRKNRNNIKVLYLENGKTLKCGKYFWIKVYGPIRKYINKNILNNNSLVFLATVGKKKILYTGDI